ncbi:hypothetical protein BVRB_7g169720 [Beta vulgaris subsp. vulgaris]|nr:hypothetical protein BVRB_7g169720 [Beta vulgaris subsp. vulgaris]
MPLLLPSFIFFIILLSSRTQSISDAEALLKFKSSLSPSEALNSWSPNTTPCQDKNSHWNGIVCFQGNVIGLRLKNMGLSGNIDVNALANLPGLRTLSFEDNNFTGPMPQFNRLGALKAIYLSNNKFSGEISSDFFSKMESLKKIWLANNTFSGEIPSSLAQLRNLLELHLENNQFSGVLPPLKQPPLVSLDLSNNILQGQIPMSLLNFKASTFVGNPKLCGEIIGKDCTTPVANESPPLSPPSATPPLGLIGLKKAHPHNRNHFKGVLAIVLSVTLVLLSLVVVALYVIKKRKAKEDNNIPTSTKPNMTTSTSSGGATTKDSAVEVDVAPNSSQSSSVSSKRSNSSKRGGSTKGGSGGAMGDLTMVNDEKGVFGLADLMKASAEVLGNGGMGSAYKAIMANGFGVAVKRMRELNRLEKDEFDVEIRKLASLRHKNVLTPLAYHYRKEEKLVVYEYVPKGSLHYILHGDRGTSHEELNWPTRLKIIKGITEGLCYLHSQLSTYELPHGNLKSSNIMINVENEPLISDYGFNPMTNPNVATQALFGYRSPEMIQHQAKVSPKCDVYCLGVVILEILTGKFPSQYLNTTKGGTDVVQWVASAIEEGREAELLDPDIIGSQSTSSKDNMVKMLHIGTSCTQSNCDKRPSLIQVKERIQRVDV